MRRSLPLLVLALIACPRPALPDWLPGGTPICTAPGTQSAVAAVTDGDGGSIVLFTDARGGPAGRHRPAEPVRPGDRR
jgi:hypothetical protein